MISLNRTIKPCARRAIIAAQALAVLLTAGSLARADNMPKLRPGMWHFKRTVGKKLIDVSKCGDPVADMRNQNVMLQKIGCRFFPVTNLGNTYTFKAECTMANPAGGTIKSHSTSVMTVESQDSYRMQVDIVSSGKASRETLVAKRTGDCPTK